MALTTTITIDQVAGSATGLINSGVNIIEQKTYNLATNSLTFIVKDTFSISVQDFIQLIAFSNNFNNQLIASFNLNQFQFAPFSDVGIQLGVDDTNDGLNYLYAFPPFNDYIFQYSYNTGTGLFDLGSRDNAWVLSYPQYLYYLYTVNYFKSAIIATLLV